MICIWIGAISESSGYGMFGDVLSEAINNIGLSILISREVISIDNKLLLYLEGSVVLCRIYIIREYRRV